MKIMTFKGKKHSFTPKLSLWWYRKICQNSGTCVKSDIPDLQCNSVFLNLSSGIDIFQARNTARKLGLQAITTPLPPRVPHNVKEGSQKGSVS